MFTSPSLEIQRTYNKVVPRGLIYLALVSTFLSACTQPTTASPEKNNVIEFQTMKDQSLVLICSKPDMNSVIIGVTIDESNQMQHVSQWFEGDIPRDSFGNLQPFTSGSGEVFQKPILKTEEEMMMISVLGEDQESITFNAEDECLIDFEGQKVLEEFLEKLPSQQPPLYPKELLV